LSPTRGFALLCGQGGHIHEVLSDTLGAGSALETGMPFVRLAAPGGLHKALSFLSEVNTLGAAYNWEINILLNGSVRTLHFTGGRNADQVLIAAAENGQFALHLFDEMMRITNEQANALRAAAKNGNPDDQLFDEISRLNNELVGMQRQLAKQNAELEHLNQEKNRFLGMAAHDLRNPLHAILALSDMMLDEGPDSMGDEYQEFLKDIHVSSQFMAGLVDNLLDVSKIEAGVLQLELAMEDLGALVEHNAARNRILSIKKGVEVITELQPVPPALLDRAKMEQVLNNLLSNAVKFSDPGRTVRVLLQEQDGQILLRVQDEGRGIPPELREKLFQPFQRGQRGTEGEVSSGLGLAIVRRIVEGHDGRIWLESEVGQGTTFFVAIPVRIKAVESGQG
jgi:signal transduction histidine kinase